MMRQDDIDVEKGVISHYTFDITFERERNIIQERSSASGQGPSSSHNNNEAGSPSGLSYQEQDQ